jgi:hypothetical protein
MQVVHLLQSLIPPLLFRPFLLYLLSHLPSNRRFEVLIDLACSFSLPVLAMDAQMGMGTSIKLLEGELCLN